MQREYATNEWQCEPEASSIRVMSNTTSRPSPSAGDPGSPSRRPASALARMTFMTSRGMQRGIVGNISHEFSCSRYQIIEPAGIEQCKSVQGNGCESGWLSERMPL